VSRNARVPDAFVRFGVNPLVLPVLSYRGYFGELLYEPTW